MALITYANKSTGDTFTAANANEIKTVVNANAFNAANTATGTDTVTINATSGVATFSTTCASTSNIPTEYTINNSLITGNSIVSVNVKATEFGYCSLVTVGCGNGALLIGVNDGFTDTAGEPIISFQILA
jgi:uncharacterized membrane protein YfhO